MYSFRVQVLRNGGDEDCIQKEAVIHRACLARAWVLSFLQLLLCVCVGEFSSIWYDLHEGDESVKGTTLIVMAARL